MAGLVEKVSYLREATVEGGTRRPDFTLLLPEGRLLHIDVKISLDNCPGRLQAEGTEAQAQARPHRRGGRPRLRAPAQGTLDFALMFIPNEQIFGAIVELEPDLLGEALRKGVVMTSPTTLFAVLAIVREVVETLRQPRQPRDPGAAREFPRGLGRVPDPAAAARPATEGVPARVPRALRRAAAEARRAADAGRRDAGAGGDRGRSRPERPGADGTSGRFGPCAVRGARSRGRARPRDRYPSAS